jgi:hypothetical protein
LSGRDVTATIAPRELVDALASVAAAEGGSWFPDLLTGRIRVLFRSGEARARCFLYRFDLSDGEITRSVVVKVRHSQPDLRRLDRFEHRPVLAPVRDLSDQDAARREYDGLRLIGDAVHDDGTNRFGLMRPLAWLPDHAAIVTDLVEEPTLRSLVLRRSRLHLGRRPPLDERSWRNAGAWLRLFHTRRTSLVLPPRGAAAGDVGDLYREYADFLVDRIGAVPLLQQLSSGGGELAEGTLPAELPLGTGHGDFVATNVFAGPEGRITGFDPLPIWRLPVYQDLATLVVGLRVLPVQTVTRGLALPRATLDRYEAEFLRGYFGEDPVPHSAVLAFQLLVLLDRWAALVSQQARRRSLRRHAQDARIHVACRHYEREARRLLVRIDKLGTVQDPEGPRLPATTD